MNIVLALYLHIAIYDERIHESAELGALNKTPAFSAGFFITDD